MKIIGRGLTILTAFVAGPALALSCLDADPARTFNTLNAAPESYVVARGVLTFDEKKMPKTDWENQDKTPPETRIPARFSGVSLSPTGFDKPFDRSVTLNALCYGPWCVHASSGTDMLAFIKYEGGKYEIALDPCYTNGFPNPSPKMLRQMKACMQGKACEPAHGPRSLTGD